MPLAALAACGFGSNADLANLVDRRIELRSIPVENGETVIVSLTYAGVSPPVEHDCAELGALEVSLNGEWFDEIEGGEWRDTTLAGSQPYCNSPEFRMTHVFRGPTEQAILRIADGSAEIVAAIPRLLSPRTIALADLDAIGPGDTVRAEMSLAAGDQLGAGRAYADVRDANCSHWPLFDLPLSPADDAYAFVVPDLLSRQSNGTVFTCDEPLAQGVPQPAALDLAAITAVEVAACDGAVSCTATRSFVRRLSIDVVP